MEEFCRVYVNAPTGRQAARSWVAGATRGADWSLLMELHIASGDIARTDDFVTWPSLELEPGPGVPHPLYARALRELIRDLRTHAGSPVPSCDFEVELIDPARHRGDAVRSLTEAAALWWLGDHDTAPVVRLACAVLVYGPETPALVELAGLSITAAEHDVGDALARTITELRLPVTPNNSEMVAEFALQAKSWDFLRGRISVWQLTEWAYRTIGNTGIFRARTLANLDIDHEPVGTPEISDLARNAAIHVLTHQPG